MVKLILLIRHFNDLKSIAFNDDATQVAFVERDSVSKHCRNSISYMLTNPVLIVHACV